jgi:hypothetical protein
MLADGSLFGTLTGRVKDESGAALPGASVELSDAGKGFRRNLTSDASGAFNFPLLPPGRYTVKATLASFESFESDGNVVTAEKTTSINIVLKLAAAQESVTVSADAPLVDKTNVSDTTHIDSSLTDTIAIARGYQTVADMAPGVNDADGDGNSNSHGAIDSSNLYLFDGVDTTDPTTGTFGANNNFDTIQEVVVANSAISAEYGRVEGAVINVITKSGTNVFHGSGRALVTNDQWNAQNKGGTPDGTSFARTKLDKNVYDYLFTLGGPVWKDNIWFFGAYERNPQFTPPQQTAVSTVPANAPYTGQNYSQARTFVAWQGKLTGQINSSNALLFSAQADPFTGIVRDYWGLFGIPSAETAALTSQDQSNDCPWACIWQARYTGVYGSQFSAEATYAQQRGGLTVGSYQGHGSPYFNSADGFYYNGATFNGFVERPRDQANLALNMYTQLFGHSHQVKVGVDYQSIKSESFFTYPNNESFFVSGFDAATHTPILQPNDLWLQGTTPLPSVSTGKIYGIYALDRFDATDRLSFNLGVRVDIQNGQSDLRQAIISATTVSPRLTASYDIFGNGKTLASVAFGEYRDFIVQNLIDSIYSGVPQLGNFNVYAWDGSQWQFAQEIRSGGSQQPIDTGLVPSKVNEFNIAFQQQIGNAMAVGVRGVYRRWANMIDDARFINSDQVKITTPDNFSSGQLKRYYKAIELTFEKRFAKNWQALASYTLSRAEGNTEAVFSSQLFDYNGTTCHLDPVESDGVVYAPAVSGNCPNILAFNRRGLQSYDTTSLGKVFVAYTYPLSIVNLTAAPSFTISSGLPYQQQQVFNINTDTDVYYYTPKGSDRLPTWYSLNFALAADFKVFGPVQFGIKGEIQNLTNQQPVIANGGITLLPGPDYGLPTSRNSLEVPRNYQFSAYVRF